MKMLKLVLTDREIELLRNSTSDLGDKELPCVTLRLKIAESILEAEDEAKFDPADPHAYLLK